MRKFLIYIMCLGLLLPSVSSAAEIIVSERTAMTVNDVEDDLYTAGENVSVVNKVGEDLIAAGQKVQVEKEVAQDVVALGQLVRIRGLVGDDVYAAGEGVELNSPGVDDVFMAGSNVTIAQKANVRGDVYVAGQTITIMGKVEGTVRAAGNVVVMKGAVINGDLITRGPSEPVIQEGATVAGTSRHVFDKEAKKQLLTGSSIAMWVQSVMSWFIFGWLLLYLFRKRVGQVVDTVFAKGGKSVGWGFLWLALVLPVFIISLMLVVGMPIGIAVLLTTILLIVLAMATTPIVIGVWTTKYLFKRTDDQLNWQQVLLGAIVFKLVGLIPIVGWLIAVVITVLVMGSWMQILWQMLRGSDKALPAGSEAV